MLPIQIPSFVPRKNPVPKREVEIGARLREYRKLKRYSQVAFADMLGIDSSQLASFEHGRVPLRYWFVKRLCESMPLSLYWLAEGLGQVEFPFKVGETLNARIDDRLLFSEVYDAALRGLVLDYCLSHKEEVVGGAGDGKSGVHPRESNAPLTEVSEEGVLRAILVELSKTVATTPPALFRELYSKITWTIGRFCGDHGDEIDRFFLVGGPPKLGLTNDTLWSDIPRVSSELDSLRERLIAATSPRGKRAALAASLGVPRQRVTEWLSGKKEPGGETALRLLRWVQEQERRKT